MRLCFVNSQQSTVNGQWSAIETHQCVFNFIGIIDTSLHWGMVKINHRLSNLRRFVRYNLFLRCILQRSMVNGQPLRRINVCLILLELLIRLYIGGWLK